MAKNNIVVVPRARAINNNHEDVAKNRVNKYQKNMWHLFMLHSCICSWQSGGPWPSS